MNNTQAPLRRTPLIWLGMSSRERRAPGVPLSRHDDKLLAIARELIQAGADVTHEDTEKGASPTNIGTPNP